MSATVLLAEDDNVSREIYHTVLERAGYQVIDAEDGEAALQVLTRDSIDVLLTDVYMPGVAGIELVKEGRKLKPNLRAIVMTSLKTSEAVIAALRNQACEFLSKPFKTDELLEAIESVMSRDFWCEVEVISDRPDWIEIRVPCDLTAVEP